MSRFSVLLISFTMLAVAAVGPAQTREEFKQRYGPPDPLGRYVVRPNIGLLIKRDQNQALSEMVIELLDSTTDKVMPSGEAEKVLTELVPHAIRGKKNEKVSEFSFACTTVRVTDYDQITTSIVERCRQQGGGIRSMTVRWKKK